MSKDNQLTIADNAIQIPGVQVTRIGLIIESDISPEDAANVFACVERITGSANWIWGDILAFSERMWGNQFVEGKYAHAIESTGLASSTLRQVALVSVRIPIERRRPELTFTHHAEVAMHFDTTATQDEWLDKAIAGKWSAIELRRAIRKSKQEIHDEPNHEPGKFGPCSAAIQLSDWLEKQDITSWPSEQADAWIMDLRPMAECYKALLALRGVSE